MPTDPAPTHSAHFADLVAGSVTAYPNTSSAVPTLAEYLLRVRAAASPSTLCRSITHRCSSGMVVLVDEAVE
jgi:hypothetical protein